MKQNVFKLCILFFTAMLLMQCNNKKNGYTISGEIPANTKMDSVYLYDINFKAINSAPVINGKFNISGKVENPIKAIFGNLNANLLHNLALENADYQFVKESDDYVFKGSELQDLIFAYTQKPEYKKLTAEQNELYAKQENETDPEKLKKIENEMENISGKLIAISSQDTKKIIDGNYPVSTKLIALLFIQDFKTWPLDKQLSLLDEYEKKLGKNSMITAQRKYLQSAKESAIAMRPENDKTPDVGTKFLDKELLNSDGKMQSISSVISKNKYTLLEFWASWCGICRDEFPILKEQYGTYKGKGLEVLAISIDEFENDWKEAMKQENMPWLNMQEPDFKSPFIKHYGIAGVPTSFLMSQDGTIVAKTDELRGKKLEKTLAKYLK